MDPSQRVAPGMRPARRRRGGRTLTRALAPALALALAAAAAPRAASAAPAVAGVEFPSRVTLEGDGGTVLRLHGASLLRWKRLFKAYVAALYLPAGIGSDEVLEDVPKRLELSYFWDIEGEQFGPAAEQILERTLPEEELRVLRPRLAELHRAYRSVQPGDRYALSYAPGRGTALTLNGELLARIPGADFARAYFGIWLGPEPVDEGLRDRLLAGHRS